MKVFEVSNPKYVFMVNSIQLTYFQLIFIIMNIQIMQISNRHYGKFYFSL